MLPCAYGIGKINSYLFEITGKEAYKAITEHFNSIDPFNPKEAEKFVTNTHILFSIQLSQMYYSDDSGMGHTLSRPYCFLDAFPWFGDYLWDGNKWVVYEIFINNRNIKYRSSNLE
jgi:hypothetical protein